MITVTLNVGMQRNNGGPDLTLVEAFEGLLDAGVLDSARVRGCLMIEPGVSERTAIITLSVPDEVGLSIQDSVFRASEMLDQDCIAMYITELQEGYLIGPSAAKWGDFNADFFQHGGA